VRLLDGTRIEAELVVVGIGVDPAVGWLAGSGLELADGVTCDATLAASAPEVVAAGDVASWPHPGLGERIRVEHWTNAVEMAAAAAKRLLRGPEVGPFTTVPYFWSDQYDVKIQAAGRIRKDDAWQVVDGSLESRRFCVIFGDGARLRAVLSFGRPAALIRYRRLLSGGASWSEALAAAGSSAPVA
jgi:3-phenylpropionate/trans-cinnamate dioxygenase ferredoxin reductase component